jgi:tetratricopeptide (TPR) repeat protein
MALGKQNRVGRGGSPDDRAADEAKAAIEAGRLDEAEQLARGVLARRQNHRGALHALGVVLLARSKPAEAAALLETAARDSKDPVIETHLAMALRQTGRAADALIWLERATARQPAFATAFHEHGLLLDSLNRFEEAEDTLRKGLKLFPGDPETWCTLGRVLLIRGDRDGAQRAFARALVERPAYPNAVYGQACVLRDNGEFPRAADLFRQALRQIPEWAEARLQLGYCLLELDQWDDAMAELRGAIALNSALYDKARYILVRSARGRFWLRPSAVAQALGAHAQA